MVGQTAAHFLWLITFGLCLSNRAVATAPDALPQTLRVEARDLITDAPVKGVVFKLSVGGGMKIEASSDAEGIARFEYTFPERTGGYSFFITARSNGLVPLAARWFQESSSPTPPDRLLFQVEKGTTIGGRVLDQDGQPLSGAVVVVSVKKGYPRSKQWVDVNYESIKTDAKGHWTFTGVPEQPDAVEVAAYDYLHLTENASFQTEPYKPLSALRDGSAVLRLQRGTIIEGTVLAPDGQPVAGAEVSYGEGRGYANAIPPLKSDAEGRFTLGIKPGTVATLVAHAPGFGPSLQRVKVSGETVRTYLTMDSAHSFRGRVVDPSGKPIARAQVVAFWSGLEGSPRSSFGVASRQQLTTNDDGRFEWKEAPGKGVQVDVSAVGFAVTNTLSLASDVDHQIVLTPPTVIKGSVVDRETGQPLPRFSLTLAAAWKLGDPFIWQRDGDLDRAANKAPGSFEYTTSNPAHRYLLRVQAEGYLPEDSEPFSTDGSAHTLPFRLIKSAPVRGVVLNPDGSPARDGFVYVVPSHRDGWIDYLSLRNDDVPTEDRSGTVHAAIGSDGRFVLPPQNENFAILALTNTGEALVDRPDVQGEATLRLQPWARISGTVTIGGKPAVNLRLQSYDPDESTPIQNEPRLVRRCFVKTDAEGRFELPHVMPGRLSFVEWVPNGVNRRIWPVIRGTVDVEAGRSYDLKIGASGRLVSGQLTLPRTDDWMIRKAEIVPRNARTDWPAKIGIELLEEGHFHAIDLPPGDYALRIALHEPPPPESCGWGRVLSEYIHDFSVPAGATASDPPLDLGRLESVLVDVRPLEVGDHAPDFTIKTLEGKELKLADFRGKYVLLDFWASWCAPCLAEMPNLQALQDQYAKDPRFVIIGLSLDDQPGPAASSVKALKLSWRQGLVGPDSPVVSAYGATAIPATFLIGPEGNILAKDLRGEKTKAALAEALKP
ncbi:carboxypeptidase regulatory-like domain-containing protein [Singulisphaera sp. Ch08]|uniref:Carboxypeptidase regulatory-like domain-containing protein n=1 Tax=Singulisphaera sp. Ch08 TaxID=3120278 RepID=A0AAU7CPZ7_9BACT